MKPAALKNFLETAYRDYHRPEYLHSDPLVCLAGFKDPSDIEIAGLLAASLSYGRVEIIIRNVTEVFKRMGQLPGSFAMDIPLERKSLLLNGFKHRFNDGVDIALLLHGMGEACARYGSLEALFASGLNNGASSTKAVIANFTGVIRQEALRYAPERKKSIDYLLPSPESGSACKRTNMYLRWMVRKNDGIDLGAWKNIPASLLVVPLDTHVATIARKIGLSSRKTVNWLMAEEVTAKLRQFDPDDPVRYDFSLCRVGMADFRRRGK